MNPLKFKKMKTKKIIKFAFISALVTIVYSCDLAKKQAQELKEITQINAEQDEASETKNAIIIIKDQSGSIKNDSLENSRLKKYFKKEFYNQLKPNTDLVLMQVDNFSGSPTNQMVIPFKEPTVLGTENGNTEENDALQEFERQSAEKRALKKMEHIFYQKFFSEPLFKNSSHTCILDLIPQLQKQMNNYQTAHVIFYSDMFEDSDYRIMLNSLADSRNTAEKMAEEDLKKLEKKYGTLVHSFSKVKTITIVIPTHTYPDKIDILQFYWQHIFQQLGYSGDVSWERLPQ